MSVLDLIFKVAAPLPDIEKYDRFLFVGPHPDDIEIGAGATAAKLIEKGKQVEFLICIDGRFGTTNCGADIKENDLIKIRQEEARKSAKTLGVDNVKFLGFCDGGFYDMNELKTAIAKEVGEFQPQVIFFPDPDVKSECHIDHLNVGRLCKEIAYFANNEGIMKKYGAKVDKDFVAVAMFMTAKTNKYIKTSGCLNKQISAIFDNHLSQFPKGCDDAKLITIYLKIRGHIFGLKKFAKTAEGFRCYGYVHMHAMPESENI